MGSLFIGAVICLLLGIWIMWMSAKNAPEKQKYSKKSVTDGSGAIEGCGCTLFVVGIIFIFLIILTYFYG